MIVLPDALDMELVVDVALDAIDNGYEVVLPAGTDHLIAAPVGHRTGNVHLNSEEGKLKIKVKLLLFESSTFSSLLFEMVVPEYLKTLGISFSAFFFFCSLFLAACAARPTT